LLAFFVPVGFLFDVINDHNESVETIEIYFLLNEH